MARAVMILMRGLDITRAIGRVALKVEPALGPDPVSAIWAQNMATTKNRASVWGPWHLLSEYVNC